MEIKLNVGSGKVRIECDDTSPNAFVQVAEAVLREVDDRLEKLGAEFTPRDLTALELIKSHLQEARDSLTALVEVTEECETECVFYYNDAQT